MSPLPVTVFPLARSCGFEFDLRDASSTKYPDTQPVSWVELTDRASLEFSTDGNTWKAAQDFVRIQHNWVTREAGAPTYFDARMASMIFGLEEGITYHYRVTLSGPGYDLADSITTGTFTTLTSNPVIGSGTNTVTISPSMTGSQIRTAVAAAIAGTTPYSSPANDIILQSSLEADPENPTGVETVVRTGLMTAYGGIPWDWSGSEDAWKRLRVKEGHKIIFDCSTPIFDDIAWQPYSNLGVGITEAMHVFVSTASYIKPSRMWFNPDGNGWVTIFDESRGQRNDIGFSSGVELAVEGTITTAFIYGSRQSFKTTDQTYLGHRLTFTVSGCSNEALNKTWTVSSVGYDSVTGVYTINTIEAGVGSGTGGTLTPEIGCTVAVFSQDSGIYNVSTYAWVPDSEEATTGKIYIRLISGIDPNTVSFKIPRPYGTEVATGFNIQNCHHVVIDGLDLRFGGYGIGILNVNDLVFKNCRVEAVSTSFVTAGTSGNAKRHRLVFKDNTFLRRGQGADHAGLQTPKWGLSKASTKYENIGFNVKGVCISLLDNYIRGSFNGWSNYIGFSPSTTTNNITNNVYSEGTEIDNNIFDGCGDDAIEPEGWTVLLVVTRNSFIRCYKGVSAAPVPGGPIYILRNKWLGRGEYEGAGDIQSFLKFGNNNDADSSYKLVANNSIVNCNTNVTATPQPGLMDSGPVYNHWYYNNYVSCDAAVIDYGYGGMGYPQVYDYNRYRASRPTATRDGGYGGVFCLAKFNLFQSESQPGSDHRRCTTFLQWQQGDNSQASPEPDWPGYIAGITPQTPVIGTMTRATYGERQYYWLHDPHSSYEVGGHELTDPDNGNFAPAVTTGIVGAGTALNNITTDVGPGWNALEEEVPTIGAVLYAGETPPSGTIPINRVAINNSLSIAVTMRSPLSAVTAISAEIADSSGTPIVPAPTCSGITNAGDGNYTTTISFTPETTGKHTLTLTATNSSGNGTLTGFIHVGKPSGTAIIIT